MINPFFLLTVFFREWFYRSKVKKCYYGDQGFKDLDRALLAVYRRHNPYRLCRKFFSQIPRKSIYGETPLHTLEKIAREGGLTSSDVFVDLGAGMGRTVLFISYFFHCKALGIEQVPFFVDTFSKVIAFPGAKLKCLDFFTMDVKEMSFIYLYGVGMEEEAILELLEKFKDLRPGAKVVTVSFPLHPYVKDLFYCQKSFAVAYPWGKTDAYVNVKL